MEVIKAKLSNIYIIRLEHKDKLPQSLIDFCKKNKVKRGLVFFLGGVSEKSQLVQGPAKEDYPFDPIVRSLAGTHEILGLGTIFPAENGEPLVHAHAAVGRNGKAEVGCIRPGIETWHILEIILLELKSKSGLRRKDPKTGFILLDLKK